MNLSQSIAWFKQHETDKDRLEECAIAEAYAGEMHIDLHKNPSLYKIDYCAVALHRVCCFVECRRRYILSGKYNTIPMSLAKYCYCKEVVRETGIEVVFCVKFDDGIAYHHCSYEMSRPLIVQWFGRSEMRDINDNEPCVMIPAQTFKTLPNPQPYFIGDF